MHVVMIFQSLEKFAGMGPLFVGQFWKAFREIAQLARDNSPSICHQPLRNSVQVAALRYETRAGSSLWNIVFLLVRKRSDILAPRLDRRRLDIRGRVCMMRFDQTNVIKE